MEQSSGNCQEIVHACLVRRAWSGATIPIVPVSQAEELALSLSDSEIGAPLRRWRELEELLERGKAGARDGR